MRDIKFRAWDREEVYYNQYDENSSRMIYGITFNTPKIYTRFDLFDLMQYTGLKDRNRVEIYEGDIVKIGEELFVVEYYKGCFQLSKQVSTGTFRMFLYKNIDDLEVVGNIYENPELLGVNNA
jgi:uncharacterized phage protein (TIGR01671 family)